MITRNPQDAYLENKIMAATKEELTLMLYEGALKFCNKAIINIENKNNQEAHKNILRVEDIIQEFELTLNKEYNVSNNLELMYDYIKRRLIEANMKKDKEILLEINEYIRELRDTWKEAMTIAKTKKVAN